jgi:hypothetical protein
MHIDLSKYKNIKRLEGPMKHLVAHGFKHIRIEIDDIYRIISMDGKIFRVVVMKIDPLINFLEKINRDYGQEKLQKLETRILNPLESSMLTNTLSTYKNLREIKGPYEDEVGDKTYTVTSNDGQIFDILIQKNIARPLEWFLDILNRRCEPPKLGEMINEVT